MERQLLAFTLGFPAVPQSFSIAALHNPIHHLFVCKRIYLMLWGQGENEGIQQQLSSAKRSDYKC